MKSQLGKFPFNSRTTEAKLLVQKAVLNLLKAWDARGKHPSCSGRQGCSDPLFSAGQAVRIAQC